MKKKYIIPILIIVSLAINIYQFNSNNTLKENQRNIESNIENLQSENNTLEDEIKNKQEELSNISLELSDLQSTIESLEADNQDLTVMLEELQLAKESIEVDNGNSLTDEEKSVQSIADRLMAEHPDWFDKNGNIIINGGGTTYTQGDYEHVGTPDNGEPIPEFEFGQGDYSQLGDNVTVY